MKRKIKKIITKAFTLVELVVVIAVIAVLAGVSVATYFGVTDSANKAKLQAEMKQVQTIFTTWSLLEYNNRNDVRWGSAEDAKLDETQEYLADFITYTYDQGLSVNLNFALFDGNGIPYFSNEADTTNNFSKVVFLLSTNGYYSTFDISFAKETVSSKARSATIKYTSEFDFSSLKINEDIYKNIDEVNNAVFAGDESTTKNNYWTFNVDEPIDLVEMNRKLEEGTLFKEVNISGKTRSYFDGKKIFLPPHEIEIEGKKINVFEYVDENGKIYDATNEITIGGFNKLSPKIDGYKIPNYYKVESKKDLYLFSDFEDALAAASKIDGDVNLTLKEGETKIDKNTNIPANLSLIIPSNEEMITNFDKDTDRYNWDINVVDNSNENRYSTLVIESGVNFEVDGDIYVTGVNGEFNKADYAKIENNGTINLNKDASLSVYGMINGTGEINANTGSNVDEKMDIYDWPGLQGYVTTLMANFAEAQDIIVLGSIDSSALLVYGAMFQKDALSAGSSLKDLMKNEPKLFLEIKKDFFAKQFPFNNFTLERIQNDINFEKEASYQGVAVLTAPKLKDKSDVLAAVSAILAGTDDFEPTKLVIPILKSDSREIEQGLFEPRASNQEEHPVVKSFEDGKTKLKFNGDVTDNNAPVEIEYFEAAADGFNTLFDLLFGANFYPLDSKLFNLPLFNFEFILNENSSLTLNNKYIFYPGSKISVNNATLAINQTSQINLMERDYFNSGYEDRNGNFVKNAANHPVSKLITSTEDAKIELKNGSKAVIKTKSLDGLIELDSTSSHTINLEDKTFNTNFGFLMMAFNDINMETIFANGVKFVVKYPVLNVKTGQNIDTYVVNTDYRDTPDLFDITKLKSAADFDINVLKLLLSSNFHLLT